MLKTPKGEDILNKEAPTLTLAPAPIAAWVDLAAAASCAVTTNIIEQMSFEEDDPPVQLYPDSMVQVELHPSPFLVFLSSQYVETELNLIPSPQISIQKSFEIEDPPVQVYPDSMIQVELQPSLLPYSTLSSPL